MAKRKAGRAGGRTGAARKGTARTSRRKKAGASARGGTRRTTSRGAAARKTARKSPARKATGRKTAARKATSRKRTAAKATPAKAVARKMPAKTRATTRTLPARRAPGLDRERRVAPDDDIVLQTPPSSLDLDRSASAARSGRRELRERFAEHTETSPALTGGDVDADWESAYSVGDEAPGGDNPTPDQDIVDDIGRAVGLEYQDNEELKSENKLLERDKHRWELDPASSEDYGDRD